jgi:hypothetical protein
MSMRSVRTYFWMMRCVCISGCAALSSIVVAVYNEFSVGWAELIMGLLGGPYEIARFTLLFSPGIHFRGSHRPNLADRHTGQEFANPSTRETYPDSSCSPWAVGPSASAPRPRGRAPHSTRLLQPLFRRTLGNL